MPAQKRASGEFWRGASASGLQTAKPVAAPERIAFVGSMPTKARP